MRILFGRRWFHVPSVLFCIIAITIPAGAQWLHYPDPHTPRTADGKHAATVLFALARRSELAPFRVLCLAVAIDYFVSRFCFLVFPVPERWAYPESNAILLSDQWTSNLIEFIRPISALNNCFPSTHVSLTVILLIVCWRFDLQFRDSISALLLTVIFATFVLGIHWLADITAGIFVGGMSVALALRWTDTSERRELALESA